MSFPIDITIPNPPNDPADDCPLIRQNFANIDGYLKVDHVAAGSTGNGFHKQITFNSLNPASGPTDPISVQYTNIGVATTTPNRPQLYWRNSQVIIPLSCVRAFGSFITTTNPMSPTMINSFNVASATSISLGLYVITLTANAVDGTNAVVLTNANNINASSAGQIVSQDTLNIRINTSQVGAIMNFVVLQI